MKRSTAMMAALALGLTHLTGTSMPMSRPIDDCPDPSARMSRGSRTERSNRHTGARKIQRAAKKRRKARK